MRPPVHKTRITHPEVASIISATYIVQKSGANVCSPHPLRKFGSQFSMTGLKQPGHSRLPKTLGRGRFGTEPMASWGMSAKCVMRGLNEGEPQFHPSERTVHHPAFEAYLRSAIFEFGDVCCRADDRAGGACNDFGRECRGDRGEDGRCRAQTRRSPQTCCGAQTRRSP